jgi:hypothetical protein
VFCQANVSTNDQLPPALDPGFIRPIRPLGSERFRIFVFSVSSDRLEGLTLQPLEIGCEVHIRITDKFVLGHVLFCTIAGGAHYVGVAIHDICPYPATAA